MTKGRAFGYGAVFPKLVLAEPQIKSCGMEASSTVVAKVVEGRAGMAEVGKVDGF